jgi:hypothetical protein
VSPRPSALRGLVKAFARAEPSDDGKPLRPGARGRIGLRPSSCGTHMPVKGTTLKQVLWNGKAREQFSVQRVEREQDVKCPECGTSPALDQSGRLSCECGELEGVTTT